ncbi:hypothetical protein R1sor_011784 [Riccia sorocarpa]|uniref:S-protein homolog n=1 Tax=Riccia sorocarpa TaxID=122646 RepID=A0ABD3I1W1_9MARC
MARISVPVVAYLFISIVVINHSNAVALSPERAPALAGPVVTTTIVNHFSVDGADGECRVRCDGHDVQGVWTTLGGADLLQGQENTWQMFLDTDGYEVDFIRCQFFRISILQEMEYRVYSENQALLSQWEVTEEGLFDGSYVKVLGWS